MTKSIEQKNNESALKRIRMRLRKLGSFHRAEIHRLEKLHARAVVTLTSSTLSAQRNLEAEETRITKRLAVLNGRAI